MKCKKTYKPISILMILCIILSCLVVPTVTAKTTDINSTGALAGSIVEEDGFTWDNANVYFLLTDRFKNGNTSNDHSYNRGLTQDGKVQSVKDSRGTFHGGDFAGVTQKINEGYFDDLGVNAIWISAPYEQIHGYVTGDGASPTFAHYSYHGYYVLDYTQTDKNFGTAEEFQTLVDTAHKHGIRVVMDIVMNHAGYNSLYDMNEYGYGSVSAGWESAYFDLNNVQSTKYHGSIDYDGSAADWGKWWGSDWIRCGCAGYTDGQGSELVQCLAGLPDFKTESTATVGIPPILQTKWGKEGTLSKNQSELSSYLSKKGKSQTVTNTLSFWLSEWVRKYGVDGFRCDTAKHVEKTSWKVLKDACVDALKEWRVNNPSKPGADWQQDFWMTGEHWDHGLGKDEYYTVGGFDSMINFDTCGGGKLASGSIGGLYQGYADVINSEEGFNGLSFMSSHDETLVRGDEKTQIYNGSAFLLLPGAVQIYYGDESNRPLVSGLPFDGYGGAGHSLRSDMNWDSLNTKVLSHWQKVGQFRNRHVSVGGGQNVKLTASNGVAFGRTYSKNGVEDKMAAVIGCNANSNVTIDVSKIYKDGEYLINTYDNSSSMVNGGKVTFNSGVNGTILIEAPNGQPLVGIKGEPQFYGEETLTVSLKDCDEAKVSIDGGNKFIVKDGDTFKIGATAYKNDVIKVRVEAQNEKAKSDATFTFLKQGERSDVPVDDPGKPTVPVVTVSQTSKLTVKSTFGAPTVYAWTGSSTAQLGAWPGTKLSLVDGTTDTYEAVMNVPADTSFNVVVNNGGNSKTLDIYGLYNGAVLEVKNNSFNAADVVSKGNKETGSGGSSESDASMSLTVVPFDKNTDYYIYLWDDNKVELAGAWPGTKLSEKDDDGNYTFTVNGAEACNCIINLGSNKGQSGDMSVVNGSVLVVNSGNCSDIDVKEPVIKLSPYGQLKQEAREILAMNYNEYTTSSWAAVQTALKQSEVIIKAGEGVTDDDEIQASLDNLLAAKSNLKFDITTLSYAAKGQTRLCGYVVPDADVKVTVDGNNYTAKSDDVSGLFEVGLKSALSSSSDITVEFSKNSITSQRFTYNMSSGDITTYIPPETKPTKPTEPTGDFKLGDVNKDGIVDIADATMIQKHTVRILTVELSLGDINGNGKIDIQDVTLLQKQLAGLV